MSLEIHWPQIALRLVLTLLAGGLLGIERSKTGHAAGLRTTLLVTLAASIAMIQMNLLIHTNGKPSDSYAVMDLMRLPLGILTGVGFIGAGAIVRKNEMVAGVTTAATLWFATVVGLCLGGGQLVLGSISAAIGFSVLWGLRHLEDRIEIKQSADLALTVGEDALGALDLRTRLKHAKLHIKSLSVSHDIPAHRRTFNCRVRWRSTGDSADPPPILADLDQLPGLIKLEWRSAAEPPDQHSPTP
ncbi:MAG: MgtC/SapB family protein [Terracidiphilus sp.]